MPEHKFPLLVTSVSCFFGLINLLRVELNGMTLLIRSLQTEDNGLFFADSSLQKLDSLLSRISFLLNLLNSLQDTFLEILSFALPDGLYKKVADEFVNGGSDG